MDTAKPNTLLQPIKEKKKSASLKYKEKDVCFRLKMKDIFPFQMYLYCIFQNFSQRYHHCSPYFLLLSAKILSYNTVISCTWGYSTSFSASYNLVWIAVSTWHGSFILLASTHIELKNPILYQLCIPAVTITAWFIWAL